MAETGGTVKAAPSVAVVGGGLAGLTSAFKLASCGFKVTLYEATGILGGNLSSDKVNGVYHDVYPHMFCEWYANFWQVFETDLGFARTDNFEPRMGVKLLDKGAKTYIELENATTIRSMIANMRSGLASWPDLFLFGFSMLDLAATPFDRQASDQLEKLDVNGFIYSRGYSTEAVAQLQNYILMVIWSIQSDLTAASSYQDFVKHTIAFPEPTPFSWLLKGSLYERVIRPMELKLRDLGCDIELHHKVVEAEVTDAGPRLHFEVEGAKGLKRRGRHTISPDYVVLAVPAPALAELVLSGPQGRRIVDRLPHLSELRRLRGEAIPVLDLYFNKKLPDIPKEQFALGGSNSDMTVLDLSQLWTGHEGTGGLTAFAVAASNGYAIPTATPDETAWRMIQTLHDYLPVFEPGARWGDPKSDIDWRKTNFRPNEDNLLFINEVGSWTLRPVASYPKELPNVFFAGDFCQTDVDMATIESAVQSGILAAKALQAEDARATGALRGAAITTTGHVVYSDVSFLAAKLALLPFAYAATAASAYVDKTPTEGALPYNVYSPKTYSLLLPLAYSLDWWKTAYWLARKMTTGETAEDDEVTRPVDVAGMIGEAMTLAREALGGFGKSSPGEAAGAGRPKNLGEALATFTEQAVRTVQAAYASPLGGEAYRRRWRMKR